MQIAGQLAQELIILMKYKLDAVIFPNASSLIKCLLNETLLLGER